jgi:hypothetical protein
MIALGISVLGVLAGWSSEFLGGTLNIAGLLAFYLLNFAIVGRFPSGVLFPMLIVPGVLYITCWWRHR